METSRTQHINGRVEELMTLIRTRPDYLNDKDAIQVLSKAVIHGNKILRETSNEASKSDIISLDVLCDYAQFLLDFSYTIEIKIVNEEFGEHRREYIQLVFGYLDEVLDRLKPVNETINSQDSHSSTSKIKELLECVYWRKGALLYMYCHTAYNNQPSFLDGVSNKHEFLTYARDGVIYLAFDMRQVRQEETTQDYVTNDEHMLMLIKEGIFSDVNMLSLMYAAEMCYWIKLIDQKSDFDVTLTFDPSTIGKQLTSQYIQIAEGPLKESKWNTEQASKILAYFQ